MMISREVIGVGGESKPFDFKGKLLEGIPFDGTMAK
jgi:hypothetical protein